MHGRSVTEETFGKHSHQQNSNICKQLRVNTAKPNISRETLPWLYSAHRELRNKTFQPTVSGGVSLLLLGNGVSPNYPGSQLLPFSAPSTDLNTSLSTHNTPVEDRKQKTYAAPNLCYCMEFFLPYPSVILTDLEELVPPEFDLCPATAELAPCEHT